MNNGHATRGLARQWVVSFFQAGGSSKGKGGKRGKEEGLAREHVQEVARRPIHTSGKMVGLEIHSREKKQSQEGGPEGRERGIGAWQPQCSRIFFSPNVLKTRSERERKKSRGGWDD